MEVVTVEEVAALMAVVGVDFMGEVVAVADFTVAAVVSAEAAAILVAEACEVAACEVAADSARAVPPDHFAAELAPVADRLAETGVSAARAHSPDPTPRDHRALPTQSPTADGTRLAPDAPAPQADSLALATP
jgi:hypothetical protein